MSPAGAMRAGRRATIDGMLELTTPDFEFVPAIAAAVEGGSIKGHDAVRRFFADLDETWETFRISADDFREAGGRVMSIGRLTAKGRGSELELDQPIYTVLWFQGDRDRANAELPGGVRGSGRVRPETEGGRMSRFEDPVIISNSISGAIANRDQCPAIPYTPEEYAAEARRAVDEGASQIHIHARTPDGTPSYEIEDFQAITEAIRAEVDDVIINYSTGAIGVPIEKRLEYLRALRPDVAALNMSSMNYAKYSRRRKDFVFKAVFENSFDTITAFLTEMNELGIQPEHECFDAGHVANLDPYLDMGLLEPPLQISLVMGVNGGIRPNARNVAFMSEQIPGGAEGPNNWQVIGVSRDQWKLLAASLNLGGNIRAGLEDNLYLPNGEMAKSNGELIAKARQMAEDVGRRAATVAEARELLGVPKLEEAKT